MRNPSYYYRYLFSKLNLRRFLPKKKTPEVIQFLRPLASSTAENIREQGYSILSLTDFQSNKQLNNILEEIKLIQSNDPKSYEKNFLKNYIGGDFISKKNLTLEEYDCIRNLSLNIFILSVVQNYFKESSEIIDVTLAKTIPDKRKRSMSQRWHRDPGVRGALKVFIYYSNVSEKSGPFEYIPKTHNQLSSKPISGPVSNKKFGGSFYPEEKTIKNFINSLKTKPKKFIGNPGMVIFCDTTGLHRGGYCEINERLMSTFVYYPKGDPIQSRIKLSKKNYKSLSKFQKSFLNQ